MKKMKMSYVLKKIGSMLLCAALICSLFSGYAGAVGATVADTVNEIVAEPEKSIHTETKLTLKKGQTSYDLTQGITYDNAKYTLVIANNGGFDINTIGDYTVSYTLTPTAVTVPAPSPEIPAAPAARESAPATPADSAVIPAADPALQAPASTTNDGVVAFTRIVSVIDYQRYTITFKIGTASINGKAVTFMDGKTENLVEIQEDSTFAPNQIPQAKETGSQESVFVTSWRHEASGMTYSPDSMTKTKFTANETFVAMVEAATFEHCTCGKGDQSGVHLSSCALLQDPSNVNVYEAKSRGEDAAPAPKMSPRMGARAAMPSSAGITVPKGLFYVSPSPIQKTEGTYAWYDSFTQAVTAIKNSNGAAIDYRMILCVDGQALTAAETAKGSAFNTLKGSAKSLTLSSSWSDPAGADTLWDRSPASWAPGTTSFGKQGAPTDAGTIVFPDSVNLGVPTTFRNMKINKNTLINAYSNKVVMGEGIENAAGTYIDLFGKTANDSVVNHGDTNVEVFSGTYRRVSGGYESAPKAVNGNKTVKIYGGVFDIKAPGDGYTKNQVMADSIDDLYNGTFAAGETTGTVSITVQPMEKLRFVAPPTIVLGDWSSSKATSGSVDRITLDTRYFKEALDMSNTVVASCIQCGAGDGDRTEVVIDINAPNTTLKEIWGRGFYSDFNKTYKTTINLNDIGTVTGYITGVSNPQMTSYVANGQSILNVNKTVKVEGIRWFSDVNIASDVNLYTNKLQMVGNGTENYNTPWVQSKLNADYNPANNFSNLKIAYNGAANVLQGGASCMLGNVTTDSSGRLSLTCDSYLKSGTPAGGILFGKITKGTSLTIAVTPNSAPIEANGKYAFLYVGRNTKSTGIQARVYPLTNYNTFTGTAAMVQTAAAAGAGTLDYSLAIATTADAPIRLSWDEPGAVASHPTIEAAVAGIKFYQAQAVSRVVKITIVKPYSATVADLTALASLTTANCKGLIITGWGQDNGWNIKGDGFLSTPNGETANVDKDETGETAGSATPYKNTAPQDANSLTLPTDGSGWVVFRLNVPTTIRNISMRTVSANPDYIDIKANGNRAQIGPGLQTSNVEYFQLYGGKAEDAANGTYKAVNYNTDVVIYNGTYRAVMADVYTENHEYINSGNTKLTIYGGTFGAGKDNPAHNIICNVLGLNDTASTLPHGVGWDGTSEINIYPSAGYDFNLNGSLVIGQAYGNAVSYGPTTINIENPDGTVFEYFPKVAPLHTTNATQHITKTPRINKILKVNIDAPNCTFGTLAASNIRPEGPLIISADKNYSSDVSIFSAKAIDMFCGFGIPESSVGAGVPRITRVFFEDGCNTEIKSKLYNWTALVVKDAKVNFKGNSGSFYSYSDGTGIPKGEIWFRSANSVLSLEKPQTKIGVGKLMTKEASGAKADGATLLVNGTPTIAGLLINETRNTSVRGNTAEMRFTNIGLVPGVAPQTGTKLLQYANKAEAIPADYTKHSSISSSIVKGNNDAPLAGQGFVFLDPQGSIRVYPAPQNSASGANQMRYTDYITLYDALADMEKYPAPSGGKYTVNFFKDYTLGTHDVNGVLAASGKDDIAKLRAFNVAGVKTIAFSSIDQKKPELLSESDMNKLTKVDIQGNKALELPANSSPLQNADPNKNEGIIFESFKFGNSIKVVAACGSAVTFGANGAANGQPGSVRMDNTAFEAYGGTYTLGRAPSSKIVVNSGTYSDVRTTKKDLAVIGTQDVTGASTIDINGGTIGFIAGTHAVGTTTVNINAPTAVDDIWDFDMLNVNKDLVIRKNLWGDYTAGCDGNLMLAPNTVLDLQGTGTMQINNLTAGNNSTIFVSKAAATNPLIVKGTYTNTGTLITDIKDINKRAEGDNLIVFDTARPAETKFVSASMAIKSSTEQNPKHVIEYGLPNNPATRLAWIDMNDSERSGITAKTLYFDSLNYKTADNNNDGDAVKKLYVLTKAQYDAFMLKADKSSANMTAGYTATTTAFDSTQQNKVTDGIGDGFHTHFYSRLTMNVDPNETYYVLTYAGQAGAEAFATGMIDVHAPDVLAANRKPIAIRGTGTGDNRQLTVNIPVKDFNTGVAPYAPSNIYRIGWSETSVAGVTEPDLTAKFPTGAYNPLPALKGPWTFNNTEVYTDGVSEKTYSFTVNAAKAKTLPNLYLYMQDMLGNTKEIELVPNWQLTADVTYKPGTANSVAVAGTDIVDTNKPLDKEVVVQKCPDIFVPTKDYAFAGWKVTAGAAAELNKTYFPVNGKFTITTDTELTAQWLPDTNKDKVPDEWQQKISFSVATADEAIGGLNDTATKKVDVSIPQLKADGTYTNNFDPSAATKQVTLLVADVPIPVSINSSKFTMWTQTDAAGAAAVTPAGTILAVNATTIAYFAHFKETNMGNPFITQTSVTHTTAPSEGAAPTAKTLAFNLGLKAPQPGETISGTTITEAFVSTDATWTFGDAKPTNNRPITLTTPNAQATTGTLTGDFITSDTWYAYVVTNGEKVERIALDTHAPESYGVSVVGGTIVKKNETTDHTDKGTTTSVTDIEVTILLEDVVKAGAQGYTASGLNKAGWSKTQLTPQQKTALCAADGFTTANGLTEVFADKASTVTVKFNTAQDTFYLYTRDMLGNMVEQQQSTAPVYNVSVPTWIGLVAVHGQTEKLITPTDGCYIVNNSTVPVKATITSFVPTGAANQLTLSDTPSPTKDQMNLTIKEKDSNLGFVATSVSAISDMSPLELGVMPKSGTATPHGVGFTFTAKYNADIALKLTDWDLFTMSYKFEIQP